MLFPVFQSIQISDSYIADHDLDASVQPADVPAATFDEFRRKMTWREVHAMERVSYPDPTFRAFLSTNERTPDHAVHKNCGDCRRCGASCRRYCECAVKRRAANKKAPRINSVPSEDLLFALPCVDGTATFGRRVLMAIRTAVRTGRLNPHVCTTADVRAIEEGVAR